MNENGQAQPIDVDFSYESRSSILIPARTLDYGLYRFRLEISMHGETGIESYSEVDIKIVATDLVVQLVTYPLMM